MMIPLITAVRVANPGACLEVVVEESAAALLRQLPELDTVYALSLGSTPPLTLRQSVGRVARICREYWRLMRHVQPTLCLLPRWGDDLFRSHVLAYLTGAPTRVGFSWDVRDGAIPAPYRDAFLTRAVHGANGLHEPVRFCLLGVEAGLIRFSELEGVSAKALPTLQRVAAAEDWVLLAKRLGLKGKRPFLVIAPGASHPKKMWPLAHWIELFSRLGEGASDLILLSGPADAHIAQNLYDMSGGCGTLLAGKTTLLESLTVIAHATLFLGNDSGPAHMAGALGVPTVALYTTSPAVDPDDPYSPARNRPLGPYVACCQPAVSVAPCMTTCSAEEPHCIANISPADVIEAVHTLSQLQRAMKVTAGAAAS